MGSPVDEGGSLPLTMLAAIVLAGVVVALFSFTRTGVDFARQDRDWHAAIQVADAGVQQGLVLVRNGTVEATCPGGVCEGDVGDQGRFIATYRDIPGGVEVRSRGTYGARTRTVVAEIRRMNLVGEAGVVGLDLVAVSGNFGSAADTVLGSRGSWDISPAACNNTLDDDQFEAYNPEVPDVCGVTPRQSQREFPDIAARAYEAPVAGSEVGGECVGQTVYASYPADVEYPHVRGNDYCVEKVEFRRQDGDVVLSGPEDEAVRIFVRPGDDVPGESTRTASLTFDQEANVNVNAPGGLFGSASALQIYIGSGKVELIGNQIFSGLLYAPNSYCSVAGTVEFNGAIVCSTADMRGNFTRADEIGEILFGSIGIERWYEPFEAG